MITILLYVFAVIAFPVVFFVLLHHIIKSAVRNAMGEVYAEIVQERRAEQGEYPDGRPDLQGRLSF